MAYTRQNIFTGANNLGDLYAMGFGGLKTLVSKMIEEKKPLGWLKEESNILLAEWEDRFEYLDRRKPGPATTVRREEPAN